MQKNYLIIGAIVIGIIILVGGGFFFLNQNNSNSDSMISDKMTGDEAKMDEDNVMTGDEAKMEGDDEMMMTEGDNYVEYTSTSLDETSDSKRVLFFYANWCPTCRPVDTELKENSDQIPAGVKIIRVNYNDPDTDNEEKELASTYGVTYQHTFVQIDENGNEVAKWSSGGLDDILENIK